MDFDTRLPKQKLNTEYVLFQPIDSKTHGLNSHEKRVLEVVEDYRDFIHEFVVDGNKQGHSFEDMMSNEHFRNIVEYFADEIGDDSSHLSLATQQGYFGSFKSLFTRFQEHGSIDDFRLEPEEVARKRSSMRTYKNAIHFVLREQLKKEKKSRLLITLCINTMLQAPYLMPGVRLARKLNAPKFAPASQPKLAINELSQNWQKHIYTQASPQMKPYLAILEATGCRPEELEKGVRVQVKDDEVLFRIQNAKIGGHREISTAIMGSTKELVEYMKSLNVKVMTFRKNKGALSQYFRDNRKRWGSEFSKITSYFYRYQKATDLKAMQIRGQISDKAVSHTLGHLDMKTKKFYIAEPSVKNVSVNIKAVAMYR